jgi:hypothetical protein
VKFFDSKYRLFGVINLIDLVVIIAILAGAYAVYRVLTPKGGKGGNGAGGVTATFDVICPSTRYITADQVKVGDLLYKNTGQQIGKVTAVKVVPSPGEAWDSNLHKIVGYQSTYVDDVIISATTQGQPTSTGFAVGSVLLHSFGPTPVMTSTFDCDTAFLANLKISGH